MENAYLYLASVNRTLRRQGKSKKEIKAILDDAQSGDYDHLRSVCAEYL